MDTQADKTEIEDTLQCLKKTQFSLPAPTPERFSNWAHTLFGSNRLEEALDAFTECLRLNPQDMNAMYNRGLIKGILRDEEGALSDLSLVLLQRGAFDLSFSTVKTQKSLTLLEDTAKSQPAVEKTMLNEAQVELEEINKDLTEILRILLEGPSPNNAGDGKKVSQVRETEVLNGRIEKVGYCLPSERLSDVQGLETAKEKLWSNVILPIVRPDLFTKYKKKRNCAVLLYGPPGCGKTFLIKALAGETDSYVVLAKLNELMDKYIGNTEKNIHVLFEGARELARNRSRTCILFLDEFDSVGVNRGSVARENSGSHRDAVDQLLVELDGLEKNPEGLFVVAATNRPWDVDAALKRSGRIGESIYINPPSFKDRKCLFEYYIGNCVSCEVDYDRLAALTEGCSAADIEGIVDKAKLRPIKREHQTGVDDTLSMSDLEDVLSDPVTAKGSLGDWYLSVAHELSQEPIDAIRYKPLVEDVKKVMRNNSPLVQTPCT